MNGLHGIIFAYEKAPGLRELTEARMPGSVPFGGRYRVVDFMLSNMAGAGITDVGVVLHGNYQSLLDHIGSGKTWDMARKNGGLKLLPPFADARKLHGVLNGIDMQRYDPSRDKNLAAAYSPDDLAGKKKDKAALQRVLGLQERPDTPILAMVTRLVSHKGLDLVCETLDAFMGKDVQFVVLGKGDAKYETFFEYAKQRYGGRMAVYLGYSEQLAMQIYAGADLFLMPSKSEPCGLSQMIAMRYGAVPIVRETGGLKDTVHAYEAWNGQGNGFTFANYNAGDMCHVICEAIDLYHDNKGAYAMLQQRGMTADFSWTRSAQEYRHIYESICR